MGVTAYSEKVIESKDIEVALVVHVQQLENVLQCRRFFPILQSQHKVQVCFIILSEVRKKSMAQFQRCKLVNIKFTMSYSCLYRVINLYEFLPSRHRRSGIPGTHDQGRHLSEYQCHNGRVLLCSAYHCGLYPGSDTDLREERKGCCPLTKLSIHFRNIKKKTKVLQQVPIL